MESTTNQKLETPQTEIVEEARKPTPSKALPWLLNILCLGAVYWFTVPAGYARVITRWGNCVRDAKAGLRCCIILWGFFEKVEKGEIDTRLRFEDYVAKTILTNDAVECAIDVVVYWQVESACTACYLVENYEKAIEHFIQATLRNECGERAACELLASREEINASLEKLLREASNEWGIRIQHVEIEQFDFVRENTSK